MTGSIRVARPGRQFWWEVLMVPGASNQKIADKLRELADLLEQQGANPFRVGA